MSTEILPDLDSDNISSQDYLKYGIGIGADYSDVNFDQLEFKEGLDISSEIGKVYSLKQAGKKEKLQKKLDKFAFFDLNQIRSNKFFAKNALDYTDAYFLHITEDTKLDEFQLLELSQRARNSLGYLFVLVEPNCQVKLIEHTEAKNYLGLIVDLVVAENSNCEYIINQKNKDYTFTSRQSFIHKDASITWFDFNFGSRKIKSSISNQLLEQGSEANIYGAFFGNEDQQMDLYNRTVHKSQNTDSDMKVKGILDDDAKGIYRGLVKVAEFGANSQGYQKEDTLLLSEDAEISSVPDLEIANNEVMCSHGVTTSKIKKEDLFYLQSRGMDLKDAKEMFVLGHVSEVLEKIDDENIKEEIKQATLDKMKGQDE
jgi:Fe-S cluster assembly protein SufD